LFVFVIIVIKAERGTAMLGRTREGERERESAHSFEERVARAVLLALEKGSPSRQRRWPRHRRRQRQRDFSCGAPAIRNQSMLSWRREKTREKESGELGIQRDQESNTPNSRIRTKRTQVPSLCRIGEFKSRRIAESESKNRNSKNRKEKETDFKNQSRRCAVILLIVFCVW